MTGVQTCALPISVLIYLHEFPPEVERAIRAEARRFKEPLPVRMQNKPDLYFGNALFLNAWFDLDQERERPSRITRTMCFQYALDYDFELDQRDDLYYYVIGMDAEFLTWWRKKQPKQRTSRTPNGRP